MSPSGAAIGLYYVALFGALGLYLPYLSLYLSSVGLTERAAVQVQAVVPFVSLFTPPLIGLLADARHARIWLLRGCSVLAALAFVALGLAGGNVIAIAASLAIFALVRSPLVALADATTHDHVRHHGGSYGRLRTWGSAGYVVTVLLAGVLYGATSIRFLVWCTTAAFAALVACAWRMPAPPVHREAGVVGEVGKLLGNRAFLLLLVAIATGQAAGTCYDTTLALHLRHLGYSKDFLGLVVGIGTAAEVVVIAASGRVLARLGSERALVVAFGVAAVRWFSLSLITSTAGLVIQAPLHALSFGLYWVAATTLMREYTGTRAPAAGQGLLGAAVAIGTIAGNVSGGRMLERGGGSLVFAYAAGVSGVAAVLAALHALVLRRAAPGR